MPTAASESARFTASVVLPSPSIDDDTMMVLTGSKREARWMAKRTARTDSANNDVGSSRTYRISGGCIAAGSIRTAFGSY